MVPSRPSPRTLRSPKSGSHCTTFRHGASAGTMLAVPTLADATLCLSRSFGGGDGGSLRKSWARGVLNHTRETKIHSSPFLPQPRRPHLPTLFFLLNARLCDLLFDLFLLCQTYSPESRLNYLSGFSRNRSQRCPGRRGPQVSAA